MNKRMKHTLYIIYIAIATTLLPMVVVGCADDSADLEPRDVSICVQAVWQNGLEGSSCSTSAAARKIRRRVLTATDILAAGTADITIAYADYPATIKVDCSDGTDLTLTKGSALCSAHSTFWSYTPSVIYKDQRIIKHDLTFTATATIDGGDELTGEATQADLQDTHLQFTLHHTKALLRFAFAVSEKYDKVRYILITGISFNDVDYPVVPKVLKVSEFSPIAYCYLDPATVDLAATNTIQCTYSIYDKDATFTPDAHGIIPSTDLTANATHLTRKDVKAQNQFTLSRLKDASSNSITKLRAGYYYDLRATLNPAYLYVLAEHDNKHLTIN